MHGRTGTTIVGGAPSRVVAAAIPLLAAGLVASSAWRGGFEARADDVVAPWVVAVLTALVAVVLAVRAVRQRATLEPDRLRCRNLATSFVIDWDDVEELEVVRRRPLVVVEIRSRSHRRRHRVGAATRFEGPGAEQMLLSLRAHPRAGAVLVDPGP